VIGGLPLRFPYSSADGYRLVKGHRLSWDFWREKRTHRV